jgi:excisionase family DNA binding protein
MTALEKIQLIKTKPFLTLEDAALYLSLSTSTIYKLCSQRKISYLKPNGKENFFRREDLDSYLLSTRIPSKTEIEKLIDEQIDKKYEIKKYKKNKRV